jgi:secreted trypsin-like serine protease
LFVFFIKLFFLTGCQGDSGNGLFIKETNLSSLSNISNVDKNPRIVVVGIVSNGFGCAEPNKLGTYTRVSFYMDWILANSVF